METLIFNGPLNQVSFGNVSYNVLRELWKQDVDVAFYPQGEKADASAFDKVDPEFANWLTLASKNRHKNIHKDTPSLRLWHIQGSEQTVGKNSHLLTFHETSEATLTERRLLAFHKHIFFSSEYTKNVFSGMVTKSSVLPLGFDTDFHKVDRKYYDDDVVHFGLMGKLEHRKHTAKIIDLWARKFGNNLKFRLTTVVYNHFLPEHENQQHMSHAFRGKRFFNIQNITFLKTNSDVNDYINSIDIELSGLSGAEGWNLPAFNASCLGKWCPVYNHTAHSEWATEENCILLPPEKKEPIYDGKFFIEGYDFNQGDFFGFDEEKVSAAMDLAVLKAKTPNPAGLSLQEKFSYERTVKQILDTIF